MANQDLRWSRWHDFTEMIVWSNVHRLFQRQSVVYRAKLPQGEMIVGYSRGGGDGRSDNGIIHVLRVLERHRSRAGKPLPVVVSVARVRGNAPRVAKRLRKQYRLAVVPFRVWSQWFLVAGMSSTELPSGLAGQYIVRDKVTGEIVYVGKSKYDLRARVRHHFTNGRLKHNKAEVIFDGHASRYEVCWIRLPISELAKVERELIAKYRPKYNTAHVPASESEVEEEVPF